MFIQKLNKKTKNKIYFYPVIIENYRENRKVKHRILASLSKCQKKVIEAFDKLLKYQIIIDIFDFRPNARKIN